MLVHFKPRGLWSFVAVLFSSFIFLTPRILCAESLESDTAKSTAPQILNQPTEIITDTPLSSFSERSGVWPAVIAPQDLFIETAETLADYLNQFPGIQARQYGSPTVSIRGSAQADRVLKLFDGVPLNLADGFGGSDLFLPQETLGSIRILKGPSSVFYGSSGMAGAIDYRLRIFERPAARLALADDTGTLGPRSIFGVVPFRVASPENQPNFQVSAFAERIPGAYEYDSVSGSGSGRLDHNWNETERFTFGGDVNLGQTEFKPRIILVRSIGESPGALSDPFISTIESNGSLVSLEAVRSLTSAIDFGVRLSDVRLHSKFDRDTPNPSDSNSSQSAASVDLNTLLFQRAVMRTFSDFRYNEFSASYLDGQKYFEHEWDAGQIFEVPLSREIVLSPGYRYQSDSGDWFKSLSLTRTKDSLRTWALYSEGFRAPSLSDLHADVSDFKGNPALQPERSRAVELGFLKEAPRRFGTYAEGLSYGAAVYGISYYDLVDTIAVGTGVRTKINSGRAHSVGLELNSAYSQGPWVLSVSYNLMDARNNDTGEPLRLAPKNQLNARLSLQLGPFIMEIEDTYWSSYFDRTVPGNELKELPAWNIVDFNVRTLGLSDWEVKGGVLNIFDVPRELTLGYPEPQRRFYISALRYF